MGIISNRQIFILVALFTTTLFLFNWSVGLWDQDEAAYAGFALRMNQTGNYLIPEFPWSFIHRKPPLHFWMNAFWFKIFGPGEFATRFSSVLSVIFTVITIWKIGGKVFGEKVGRIAAVVGMCSLYGVFLAKIAVTDADLMFFETLAVLSLLWYLRKGNNWALVFCFIGVAGGGLVKGPPVFVVSIGMLGLLFFIKQYRIRTLIAGVVVLIGFLPLYIWGSLTWQEDGGDFVEWLINWYVLSRNKPFAVQTGPPGYFLIFFILTFFAFSGILLKELGVVFKTAWKKDWASDYILVLAWILPGWFLYEFIPSKLPTYAIACFGAVAILVAKGIESKESQINSKWPLWLSLVLGTILGLALVVGPWFVANNYFAVVSSVIGGIVIVLSLSNFKAFNLFKASLTILLVGFGIFSVVIPSIEDRRGVTKVAANLVEEKHNGKKVLVTHNIQLPSFLFYLENKGIEYELNYNPQPEETSNVSLVYFNKNKEGMINLLKSKPNYYAVDSVTGWQYDRGRLVTFFVLSERQKN